jgi:hypothetical protein
MIYRLLIITLLTIAALFLFEFNNYLEKKNYYLQKEINKYQKLINELKKINIINKKLYQLHIPIFSKNEAQNILLEKIDQTDKKLPLNIKNYSLTQNTVYALLYTHTNSKHKKEIIDLFKTKIPIVKFDSFETEKQNIKIQFKYILPFKDENGK